MTKNQFLEQLAKEQILLILEDSKKPLTAKEIASILGWSTAKTSAFLYILVNNNQIYKYTYPNNQDSIYSTKPIEIYPLYYQLYKKLINFINERRK